MTILFPYDTWPDVELVAISWLRDALPDARVLSETGTDLADLVNAQTAGVYTLAGVVQVRRVPGGSNDQITEVSQVDVDCIAPNRDRMWHLAARAQSAMLKLAGNTAANHWVDWVEVSNGAGEVPYNNPRLRRSVTTFQLTARVQALGV